MEPIESGEADCMSVTGHWNAPGYQRFVAVHCRDHELVAQFEDGTTARVDTTQVLPTDARGVDWDALTFDAYEIHLPSATGDIEIPWSTIRVLSDPQYSAHLATAAAEQARRIGSRIKKLRKQRHLTTAELAARAGITPAQLARLEGGDREEALTGFTRLLAAMDCTLQDLISPELRAAAESEDPSPGSARPRSNAPRSGTASAQRRSSPPASR
jgi:DNA-binding Xre family transcriptional regulator